VRELAHEHPLAALCRALEVPRGTARHAPRPRPLRDLSGLKATILTILVTHRGFGVERAFALLRRMRVAASRSEVRRAYLELGLLRKPAPRRVRTTDSSHAHPRHPNLVEGLAVSRPDQVWVADVTYVRLPGRFCYLALVMDAFTREILGFALSLANDTRLTLEALGAAFALGRSPEIHHSDQGSNYASEAYVRALRDRGVAPSMARAGRPDQNGRAERLNRTVKEEEVWPSEYRDLEEAREGIRAFVRRYNEERIHSALGWLTPNEAFRKWAGKKPA
jgi:transposase InsO family protein